MSTFCCLRAPRHCAWILAVPMSFLLGAVPQALAQDTVERAKVSIFGGVGWAYIPSTSGFFGEETPAENHFAVKGGAEVRPFSHIGFEFDVAHTRRSRRAFNGPILVQSIAGDTFITGDAVFHMFVRHTVSPF